uniref:Uncharacterized protein n=1 Tax=Anguilla anguilla TaxID=7936 RepID=A0A0E9TGA5_ANGAN
MSLKSNEKRNVI